MSRSRSLIFAMRPFDGKYQNIQSTHALFFFAGSQRFRYINGSNFLPSKTMSRSRSIIFTQRKGQTFGYRRNRADLPKIYEGTCCVVCR